MKDQADKQAIELFPDSPKRRGRPSSGKGKNSRSAATCVPHEKTAWRNVAKKPQCMGEF